VVGEEKERGSEGLPSNNADDDDAFGRTSLILIPTLSHSPGRVPGPLSRMSGEKEGEQERPVTPKQPTRYLERDPPVNLLLGSAKLEVHPTDKSLVYCAH